MSAALAGPSLIVTDLDGTLWHLDDDVHPDTRAAIDHVVRAGPPLLVATGRRRGSTRAPLQRIGVAPPAIVLNGALGVDLATLASFYVAPFPREEAVAVLEAFRAEGLDPCVYVDHPDYEVVLSERPSTNPGHAADLAPDAIVGDLDAAVTTLPVLAFALIGVPHPPLVAVKERLEGVAETALDRSFDYPGLATMTVAPRSQSKWDGVLAFCRRAGCDPSRVVALGDGPNDLELLANASVALVPANAHASALELADVVIPPAKEGGWAAVLDYL